MKILSSLILIWETAIFMTIYSDLIVGSFEHCYISVEQTYIHCVRQYTCQHMQLFGTCRVGDLQCNILLWMKVQLYLRYV